MYRIVRTDWGFQLTFGESASAEEMRRFYEESKIALQDVSVPFYVFVDMRTLIPLDKEAQIYMFQAQRMYREMGMERSVVILTSPVVAAQFRRIGGETGIGRWERYIDASSIPDWREVGMAWLLDGVDPEEAQRKSKTDPLIQVKTR